MKTKLGCFFVFIGAAGLFVILGARVTLCVLIMQFGWAYFFEGNHEP